MPPLVLASSSTYRRQLLEKLGIAFLCQAPNIDESPIAQETPEQLVQRLAEHKATALADNYPNHLIIGSDQVAVLEGQIIGKPGNHNAATQQLSRASGKYLQFLTGLCLFNSLSGQKQSHIATYEVKFRPLTPQQIETYLRREQPYDCAGSFKSEGLGISLFEYIRGDDPNSLVGLPLIELNRMLLREGVDVLAEIQV